MMFRNIPLIALLIIVMYFGTVWVITPLTGTQGISNPGPQGEIELVKRCNPFHLIPPAWFINDDSLDQLTSWMLTEAAARAVVVGIGIGTICMLIILKNKERQRAGK